MIFRKQVRDKHWLMPQYLQHRGNTNICVWGWRKENVKKIKIKNPLSWAKLCNEWEGVGWRILILSSRKPERDLLHTLHLNEPSASSCWCCIASSVINSRTTPSTRCLSLPALAWGQKAADGGRWIQNSDRSLALFLLHCSQKPDWEALRWAFQPSAWQGRATWGSKGWRGTRTRCRSRCAYRASPPFGNFLLFCALISLRWLLKLYCLVLGGLGLLLCLVRKISSYLLSYNS